ncbi:MAG TPA: ribonuclease P protein component [Terriglobales bacterium]|nr:ribonuclease P protein component [Terriglobales bacterium]
MPSFVEDCEVVIADSSSRSGNEPAGLNFPKAARLLKHADFERVYKQGRRHFSSHMTVFYLSQAADAASTGVSRVGFTVGRVLGGAVERNRIKRRLREAVRLRRAGLVKAVDVVINPKKSILALEFPAVLEEVGRAFDVIAKKLAAK